MAGYPREGPGGGNYSQRPDNGGYGQSAGMNQWDENQRHNQFQHSEMTRYYDLHSRGWDQYSEMADEPRRGRGRRHNPHPQYCMPNYGPQQRNGGEWKRWRRDNEEQHYDNRADLGSRLKQRRNARGSIERFVRGVHMPLEELTAEYRHSPYSCVEPKPYINWEERVPRYPGPVEFRVSRIAHVTTEKGLNGILGNGGFKGGKRDGGFLWWGLALGQDEIAEAEDRYVDTAFPIQSPEKEETWDGKEEPFLSKFTTSPVFKDGSRYGNFRFSFSLEEILREYSTQFCGGAEPVIRVWETIMYKQEIMYSLMIHSPEFHLHDDLPTLGKNVEGVCAYHEGQIMWHAHAISGSHEWRLIEYRDERWFEAEPVQGKVWYMWDHVTLAFYIPEGEVLSFPKKRLLDCLTACRNGDNKLNDLIGHRKAKAIVSKLKRSDV
ncbi:uncharacterized protein LOC134461030 [Engraulis encrasicolus]|uniref:uncharacterized protein LOC134461030 n=1 Tax=Engraulis encrasicolus TaxID=184585 RepID=UPI002FD3E129